MVKEDLLSFLHKKLGTHNKLIVSVQLSAISYQQNYPIRG
jgi:hypothetical protein